MPVVLVENSGRCHTNAGDEKVRSPCSQAPFPDVFPYMIATFVSFILDISTERTPY